ncbi:hypothetical protein THASP1DRAFT_22619 [Thamnocephalis sphaerospora]|uniref:SAM domain-containing protein n=1 Tax=Thamnocephalis sphaerospora TaxID=78915 RepID=A0A4P9XTN8_9FUNG|nr:hypothetical protein THASP1DRAFT_22619 [Thamnocephalis sphaerospora]|eukprot:RKP09554.1 hypothetical protein THASP1DRAFT_22619 [Thamnocephalis sphaerospora]
MSSPSPTHSRQQSLRRGRPGAPDGPTPGSRIPMRSTSTQGLKQRASGEGRVSMLPSPPGQRRTLSHTATRSASVAELASSFDAKAAREAAVISPSPSPRSGNSPPPLQPNNDGSSESTRQSRLAGREDETTSPMLESHIGLPTPAAEEAESITGSETEPEEMAQDETLQPKEPLAKSEPTCTSTATLVDLAGDLASDCSQSDCDDTAAAPSESSGEGDGTTDSSANSEREDTRPVDARARTAVSAPIAPPPPPPSNRSSFAADVVAEVLSEVVPRPPARPARRHVARSASVDSILPPAPLPLSLPPVIDYLASLPVSQWSYADVADFFRGILSLPLDLSRETADFIVKNKLDGPKLSSMSEQDLRQAGVNTQWCHRIVTTLKQVKDRQRKHRLQFGDDNDDGSLAAYIEEQFKLQLQLLRQTADGQKQLESIIKDQASRSLAMGRRIARLERALSRSPGRGSYNSPSSSHYDPTDEVLLMEDVVMEEEIDDDGDGDDDDVSTLSVQERAARVERCLAATQLRPVTRVPAAAIARDPDTARDVAPDAKYTLPSEPLKKSGWFGGSSQLIAAAQGFAVGAAVAAIIFRLLR